MMAEDEGGMPGGEEGMEEGGSPEDQEADTLYNEAMALMNQDQPEEAAEKAFNALLSAGAGTVESATENLAKAIERGAEQGYLSKEGAHKGKWVPVKDENNNVKAVLVEV